MSEFQIDVALAPSWYPDEVGPLAVTAKVTESGMKIYAVSASENPFLSLSISDFDTGAGPNTIIEKDDSDVNSHEVGGHIHYVINDRKWYVATWTVDNLVCIIRSNITEDEMLKVIDSIYEVS